MFVNIYNPKEKLIDLVIFPQKQYSDLFALAAEDDTSGVGRRGTSGRGRKPPANKKDANSSNSNNKKNSEPINNVYSSDGESSEVSGILG